MATYKWPNPPASESITQFTIEKSVDAGISFSAAETITNDPSDPLLFIASEDVFFWADATPVDGEIVRIRAENATGNGPWTYLHGPPAPMPTCHVYGVLVDAVRGKALPDERVTVTGIQSRMASFGENAKVSSLGAESLAVSQRDAVLVTDEAGRWSIDLVVGQVYEIAIPSIGVSSRFRVPDGREVLNFRDSWQWRTGERDHRQSAGVAHGPLAVGATTP